MGRTVAIVWQRFGPYHVARLRGAAALLEQNGWEVVGIEVAEEDDYLWSFAGELPIRRCTIFPKRNYRTLSTAAIRRGVADALERVKPSAVCINGWAVPEAVAALRWCRRTCTRAVLMSETYEPSRSAIKTAVKRWRVRRFDAALVGGRLHAEYLVSLGYSEGRVEIGYDVVDNQHFAHGMSWVEGRPAGLAEKRFFLANTRFLERKGVDALLHAYAHYRENASRQAPGDAPWHLVVSGSGEMESRWKALARELDLVATVHWPGFLQYDMLPSVYCSAGAFVHPARREAWGLVVNEAAAAGLPLIVGRRVGAACELLREGENGFLVDPDDTTSFALLLHRIASMTDRQLAQMGKASRRLAAQFGPERFGEALRRCLETDS